MSLSTAQINTIYQNVLQRSAVTGEQNAWFGLDQPQGPLTDGSVVEGIVQAPEAVNFTYPVVWLYQAVFGRVPDVAGLKANVDAIDPNGGGALTIQALASAFISDGGTSGEFFTRYGIDDPNEVINATNPGSAAFLTALYQNVLQRGPEPGAIANWESLGQTTAQVLFGFFESAEFQGDATGPTQELLTDDALGVKVAGFANGVAGTIYTTGAPTSINGGSLFGQNMTFWSNTQGGALDMSQPAYAGFATSAFADVDIIELRNATGGKGGMTESGDFTITNAPSNFALILNDDTFAGQNLSITPAGTASNLTINLGATSGIGSIANVTLNDTVSGSGLIHFTNAGYTTVTINNIGSNAFGTASFTDLGGESAALNIMGAGSLSLGLGAAQVEGKTTVQVGSITGEIILFQTINGTITDVGVTLGLGVTNAVKIDASAAPELLMFGPDDFSPSSGSTGITVLGGAANNILEGSLGAVTAVAGVGVTGAALNDTITGGAGGGDNIFGDGGAD